MQEPGFDDDLPDDFEIHFENYVWALVWLKPSIYHSPDYVEFPKEILQTGTRQEMRNAMIEIKKHLTKLRFIVEPIID